MLHVIVRDGRMGRDPALVDPNEWCGGEVLMEFDSERFLDEGDELTLSDGACVVVIGSQDKFGTGGVTQTVAIGNL